MGAAILQAIWTVWLQTMLLVAAGGIGAIALRWRDDARARLLLWRMVLGACLLLPLLAAFRSPAVESVRRPVQMDPITATVTWTASATTMPAERSAAVILLLLAGGAALCAGRIVRSAIALRRLARRPDLRLDCFDDLQQELGVRARLVAAPVDQPFTFGHRHPVVVVPEPFPGESRPVQRAVLAHELVHVRRRDWLQASIEAACCALAWFHPGVWWAVAELRLAREEIVDREASRFVESRRAYLTTLLDFAARHDGRSLRAVAFFRHRQLARRIAALSKEASMSPRLLVLSGTASAVLLTVAAQAAQAAFPLPALRAQAPLANAIEATEPSALERQAHQVPKDAPPPRKVHDVPFRYPEEIKRIVASALFAVRIVIDADGSVAEARILTRKVGGPDAPADALAHAVGQLSAGTLATIRQWRFEPPAKSPLAMTVTVSYRTEDEKKDAPPPPPPPPAPGDGSVTRPEALDQPNAIYPEEAKQAGTEGLVRLAVTVGRDGRVKDARVIQSVPALDRAALDAVRKWTFRPGTRNGEPVDVQTEITVSFTLRD